MSKIIDMIKAAPRREQRPGAPEFPTLMSTGLIRHEATLTNETLYEIGVYLGAKTWVSDQAQEHPEIVEKHLESLKMIMISEIFGEFYVPLMKARYAVISGDKKTAEDLIVSVLQSMGLPNAS